MRPIDLGADYPTLAEWWLGHGKEPIPRRHLPPTGLIVDNLAACFMYRTDTPVCLIEHLVGNPASSRELRRSAISEIISALIIESRKKGDGIVYALTPIEGVAERAGAFEPTHAEERKFILLRR